jgi:hypothetical protein
MPGRKSLPDTTLKRSREELHERAKRLDIEGRSRTSKKELARALARNQ